MSLLADSEYLLHTLRLSYLRSVVPSHAPQSSLPGTGPYNLLSFPANDPTLTSPYVLADSLADDVLYPELSAGRSSPPLGSGLGRDEVGSRRRREGARDRGDPGGGELKYSQTIGGKVGGIGMRVGGKRAQEAGTYRSRRLAGADDGPLAGAQDPPSSTQDSSNLQPNRTYPAPPPVVIHSPVRTPAGSVNATRPGSFTSFPSAFPSAYPSALPSADISRAESPDIGPSTGLSDDDGTLDPVEEAFGAPKEGGVLTEGMVLSPALINTADTGPPLDLLSPSDPENMPVVVEPTVGTEEVTALEDAAAEAGAELASPDGPQYVGGSIASSGISLFGTLPQTLSDSATGGLSRERSDSEPSNAARSLSSSALGEEPDRVQPLVQPAPAPAMIRPGRERRRVNISGRMLVSIQEPEKEPTHASSEDEAEKHETGPPPAQLSRRRSSTEPAANLEHELTSPHAEDHPEGRPRKNSAPSLLPAPEFTTAPTTPTARPATTPTGLAPPTASKPTRPPHSPAISFPSRASLAHQAPPPPRPSALSAMLSAQESASGPSNPFSHLYGALVSKASDGLSLSIYFPHSKTPTKPLKIKLRRDVTCEEVIGVALFSYFEQAREPALEPGEDEEGETVKWNLRIVEDDGEVDEDFPALDRVRPVSKFGFQELGVVRASEAQVRDNKAKQAGIVRRPSRTLAAPKKGNSFAPPVQAFIPTPANLAPSSGQGQPALGSFKPATMGQTSGLAVPVFLRISLPPLEGESTTIQTTLEVPSDMYISDVLDLLCRKRGLDNPREWALMVHHLANEIVVPLDRTVDSLGERTELYLVKRSAISALGGKAPPTQGYTTNPSASIFAPPRASADLSRVAPSRGNALDPTGMTYESYYVQRKLPVPMGRHPRLIAIDGFYLHFMPSDQLPARATSGRTSSYHISQVVSCGLSRRGGGTAFKIIVRRERGEKRYDFETNEAGEEGRRVAGEVVGRIKGLMQRWEDEERAGR